MSRSCLAPVLLLACLLSAAPAQADELVPAWPSLSPDAIELVQGTSVAGQAATATRPVQTAMPTPRPAVALSLASLPYMIGDSSGSSCGTLTFNGVFGASLAHPTFACSRLNIAEQNNPVVADRVYFDYRRFQAASEVDLRLFDPANGRKSLPIDRYTLGLEKRIGENTSIEVRLPINHELTSDLKMSQLTGPVVSLPVNDRMTELGNLGVILKQALYQDEKVYVSAGLGLNLPTAPGVELVTVIDDRALRVRSVLVPGFPVVGPPIDLNLRFTAFRTNETINLSPFLGCYWTPTDRLFAIGFVQFDFPLNESTIRLDGRTSFFGVPVSEYHFRGRIAQQNLLRVNLGVGGWLLRDAGAAGDISLGGMVELHYNTTISDAEVLGPVTVSPDSGLGFGSADLRFGNPMNRADVLNLAVGVPLILGNFSVTNGFVLPLRTGENRGFDLEYNLRLQWRF